LTFGPRAYYRLLGDLLASLRPANPHQRLQMEDIARLRVEKQRLQRARTALVAGKLRGLERQRDRRLLEFDHDSPDLPQAELLEKGLYRAPDSPPKFEKMLSCFDVLISEAKQGQFRLDPEPELNLLYGQEPSLEGAYLRNVFRRFVAAQNGIRGSEFGVREPQTEAASSEGAPRVRDSIQNPKSKIQNGGGPIQSQKAKIKNGEAGVRGSGLGFGNRTRTNKAARNPGPRNPNPEFRGGSRRAGAPAAAPDPVCREAPCPAPLPALQPRVRGNHPRSARQLLRPQ
jgi:hypothetical protein